MIPQSWPASDATPGPGLHRTGDIGVASDWRDLSYDWTPILTATGVTIYAYLRDTYDQKRKCKPCSAKRPTGHYAGRSIC
jgi:hypothetical protein